MSLLQYEQDKERGSRVELYLFESDDGRYRWAYTTDAREKVLGPIVYKPEPIKRGELTQRAGDANVESLEDTLSNRDKNNEIALARSIRQHEGDIKRVDADIAEIKALITQHPGTCAAYIPRTTYETPRATFFKPEE